MHKVFSILPATFFLFVAMLSVHPTASARSVVDPIFQKH
jgi:hypothetical protein